MAQYKLNHSVPKFMLEYWIDQNTPFKGVHVFETGSGRTYVSASTGSKPFSFAIIKDLYVVTSTGNRAVGLEKWLSGQEGALASIIRQAHNRNQLSPLSNMELSKAIMAIVSLEYRSAYNIRKMEEALKNNSLIRSRVETTSDRSPEQFLLENIIHSVNETVPQVIPTEMIFIFATKEHNWVIGDRPYFNIQIDGIYRRFVVLTNKVLLCYYRSNDFIYSYIDASVDFIQEMNEQITLNSRDWLVAASVDELNQYLPLFDSDKWKQRVINDQVTWNAPKFLTSGWKIVR